MANRWQNDSKLGDDRYHCHLTYSADEAGNLKDMAKKLASLFDLSVARFI
ncbi:MAG: hypothetical protein JXA71_09130 [Chitinispirillaceae bacterium]|nr:hypothetical protein [Chitinispirillaceae bacterium]